MRIPSLLLSLVLALAVVVGLLHVFGSSQVYPPTIGKGYAEDARPTVKRRKRDHFSKSVHFILDFVTLEVQREVQLESD